jgi:hypothetical protein
VLDPSLLQKPIGQTSKTFADIDTHKVNFLNINRPYSRLLYLHYRRSVSYAERKGWIEGEAEDDAQKLSDQEALRHSIDSDSATRIAIWLSHQATGSSPTVVSLAAGPSSQAALVLSSGATIGKQGSPSVVEEKACSEEGCNNIRLHKCVRKMCAKCCQKKGGGSLCEEHAKRPKRR